VKIAWFSPLPPQKSGISDYSVMLVDCLLQSCQVDLWVEHVAPKISLKAGYEVIDYGRDSSVLPLLNTYDAIVYNIGNDVNHHGAMLEVLNDYPGIVILHDFILHHLIAGYWIDRRHDPEGYLQTMRKEYGDKAEQIARNGLRRSRPLWETEMVIDYPLNRQVLDSARSIVVHSRSVANSFGADHNRVSVCLPHPIFKIPGDSNSLGESLEMSRKFKLISFGHITPSKRLEPIVDAISATPDLRERVMVWVIGEFGSKEYGAKLKQYVRRRGMDQQVTFLGFRSEEETYAHLRRADAMVQLRKPTMGETSAAVLRGMSVGLPVIVSDVGWYSEIPDAAVIKIPYEDEQARLAQVLNRLVHDHDWGKAIGRSALNYVNSAHTVENFCNQLIDLIESTRRPDMIYYSVLGRIADVCVEIGHVGPGAISSLANQMEWLDSASSNGVTKKDCNTN